MLVVFRPWNLANIINENWVSFFFFSLQSLCALAFISTLVVFATLNQAVPLYPASCWTSDICHVPVWAAHTCRACGLSQYQTTFTWAGKQRLTRRSPVGICCVTQGAQPSALWQPRGVGWGWKVGRRFKREGTYAYLGLIHADAWHKPTQHCKAIILQLKTNKLKTW